MPREPRVSTQPQAHHSALDTTTQALLDIVQQLALELHPHKHHALTVTLDSSLERDLGFDSLGRMGEANAEVFGGLLGLSPDECARLVETGVIA